MRRAQEKDMTKGRALLAISIATILAGGNANLALAAETTIRVSGDSVPSECGAAKSPSMSTELSGSLVGCLAIFAEHFNCSEMNGFAFSRELGREEFEGTLDGKPIAFNTIYTFDALWPQGSCPAPAVESEIAGGCTHYASGDGVQGVIRFYDVIPTVGQGATNFPYEGTLTVSDSGSAAITPVLPPSYDVAVAEPTPAPKGLRSAVSSC